LLLVGFQPTRLERASQNPDVRFENIDVCQGQVLRSGYAVHLRMVFDEPAAALSSDEQTQQRKAILASRILSLGPIRTLLI